MINGMQNIQRFKYKVISSVYYGFLISSYLIEHVVGSSFGVGLYAFKHQGTEAKAKGIRNP